MGLCFIPDDFIAEKVQWIATLSDGTSVYQDDNRPGEKQPIAWLRLASYIKDKQKELGEFGIEKLQIKFWNHIEEAAPSNALAYYWINGVEAFSGATRTYYQYVVGSVVANSEKLQIIKWLVPEILPLEYEERNIPYGDDLLISRLRGEALGKKQN
jgi:hypothetical protein